MLQRSLRYFDIAANLSDHQFQGVYHGKKYHESDLTEVIKRAQDVGCQHLLVASGHLDDLKESLEICKLSENFLTTGGLHPCRASEMMRSKDPKKYWENLEAEIESGVQAKKIVMIGECGLDYDRFHYSTKEEQMHVFPPHFDLSDKYKLPMYLHNRNTGNDFFELVEANLSKIHGGIVHSFTGTQEELDKCLKLGFYIGVNGCSLKFEENCKVAANIPLDRLMLETDAPYCDIKNTHASMKFVKTKFPGNKPERFKAGVMVRGRNEPCTIVQVGEVMSKLKNIPEEELVRICYENTMKFFKLPM